jgi:hypothetical protein
VSEGEVGVKRRGGDAQVCACRKIERNHIQLLEQLGVASGSFWAATQAIRATSLMSGVSFSSNGMGTPDSRNSPWLRQTMQSQKAEIASGFG